MFCATDLVYDANDRTAQLGWSWPKAYPPEARLKSGRRTVRRQPADVERRDHTARQPKAKAQLGPTDLSHPTKDPWQQNRREIEADYFDPTLMESFSIGQRR
jgi:hypothetical protein